MRAGRFLSGVEMESKMEQGGHEGEGGGWGGVPQRFVKSPYSILSWSGFVRRVSGRLSCQESVWRQRDRWGEETGDAREGVYVISPKGRVKFKFLS